MIRRAASALLILLLAVSAAPAQFADQSTWAGTGAGSANSQTVVVSNAGSLADLLGVVVKFSPGATNTGVTTLLVNAFATAPEVRKPNGSGLVSLVGGELVTGQPAEVMYNGTYFVLLAPVALPVGSGNLLASSLSYGPPPNLQIATSVGSNQLTLAVKTAAGGDPSAASPVPITFRDTTLASGAPVVVNVTSALSFTIQSTLTMGCQSGVMCRLWVVVLNNGGTPVLCAFNARSGTTVAPIDEGTLFTSVASTTGGSLPQSLYCAVSAVTAKAGRILGYVDVQEATAGTWATGPTYVQMFGPGIKKPGDVVQGPNYFQTGANFTGTGSTPLASPITLSIAPTSAANLIVAQANVILGSSGTGSPYAKIYRAGATPIGDLALGVENTVGPGLTHPVRAVDVPNTTSSTSYTVFVWTQGVDNAVVNPALSNATAASSIMLQEIQG